MNWDAIGSIGEIVGAVAVIATLIYLAAQIRQSNDHATAVSETSFIAGVDKVFHGWSSDEQTYDIICRGFSSFKALKPYEMAVFQAKVGALVNHMYLGRNLCDRNLLSKEVAEEVEKITISVLSTDGGLEYWEHDCKAMPGGPELLQLVKNSKGKSPNWSELIPWWNLSDD